MGCADVGINIIGIQEHRLTTPNSTEELWSDNSNWVLMYGSATKQRTGVVGIFKIKRDQAEKEFISSKSPKTRDRWRSLKTSLCDSYKADEAAALSNQLEKLRVADEQGDYITT